MTEHVREVMDMVPLDPLAITQEKIISAGVAKTRVKAERPKQICAKNREM